MNCELVEPGQWDVEGAAEGKHWEASEDACIQQQDTSCAWGGTDSKSPVGRPRPAWSFYQVWRSAKPLPKQLADIDIVPQKKYLINMYLMCRVISA